MVVRVTTGGPAASLAVEVRCRAEEPQAPRAGAEPGQKLEDRSFVIRGSQV